MRQDQRFKLTVRDDLGFTEEEIDRYDLSFAAEGAFYADASVKIVEITHTDGSVYRYEKIGDA